MRTPVILSIVHIVPWKNKSDYLDSRFLLALNNYSCSLSYLPSFPLLAEEREKERRVGGGERIARHLI